MSVVHSNVDDLICQHKSVILIRICFLTHSIRSAPQTKIRTAALLPGLHFPEASSSTLSPAESHSESLKIVSSKQMPVIMDRLGLP